MPIPRRPCQVPTVVMSRMAEQFEKVGAVSNGW